MTTDREMERIVRSWLDPGLTVLTDDVVDAVLDALPRTPQRRATWSAGRVRGLRASARFSLAAAAVAAVALVGVNLAPRLAQLGAGSPTPLPSPLPSTSISSPPATSPPATLPSNCSQPGGQYRAVLGTTAVHATLPRGWNHFEDAFHVRLENASCTQVGTARLEISRVAGVYADACRRQAVVAATTRGAMVTSLTGQKGHETLEPTEMTLGGKPATRFTFAASFDPSACTAGSLALWRSPGASDASLDPDATVTVYVVDVDGLVLGIAASRCCGDELGALERQLNLLVDSIRFDPAEAERPSPSPVESEPPLRLPGTRASPAGVYGFEAGPRTSATARMHKVIGEGGAVREATALTFRVGANCLGSINDSATEPVRVAGFDGVAVEPYEPPVTFGPSRGTEVTRAYALAVDDRTLCAFVTWQPSTTDLERNAALHVLDTIRTQPIGDDRLQVSFTLDEGWDTG
ncbi:MAG TPA: hypothetical protein VFV72_00325 [Candidatus Limnocylindrales bacterium]|nr:hypothetical protein [Candidatus Limnocylindrales bacterium]